MLNVHCEYVIFVFQMLSQVCSYRFAVTHVVARMEDEKLAKRCPENEGKREARKTEKAMGGLREGRSGKNERRIGKKPSER